MESRAWLSGGNTRSNSTVVEIREPVVDVFEEDDRVMVAAEMQGIGVGDLRLDLKDGTPTPAAEKRAKKHCNEVLPPGSVSRERLTFFCNNGVAGIKRIGPSRRGCPGSDRGRRRGCRPR